MRDIQQFVEQVRDRTSQIVAEHGLVKAAKMIEPRVSSRATSQVNDFLTRQNKIPGADVKAAYRYHRTRPDLYKGINPAPVTRAHKFFQINTKNGVGGRNHPAQEAASFLCSMFGWSIHGERVHVPLMPDTAGTAALGRLAFALDMDADELVDKLRAASAIRKAAMGACREVDGVEY